MNIFSTHVLSKVVENLHTPPSFLLDMFFSQEQRSETEEIYFDTQESKPRISPFVSPLMPGKVVEHEGYSTKSFKPAYVKDKRRFTPDMPFKRMAGERIGGEMTPAQRLEKAVAVTLSNQLDCLTRREEVMASEVLRTGKITVEGDGYPAVTVDFGRDASFTKVLTEDATWDNTGVNILDNLEDWAGAIQSKAGVVAKTVVLDPFAWKIFRANPFVQKYLDYRRGTTNNLNIDPIILSNEKARFVGNIGDFEVWVYNDIYVEGVVCSKRLLNQAVGKSLRTHNLKPKKGAQVMRKNEKITALYERLSRDDFGKDDDQQRESNSISNQKAMLEEFAARQGFTNIVHFTDDGISGTCFDRPGFLAMMKEVEAGNVEYLCIKDMSRMGRDYLKVGQIMEILRQRGVRLIAINDGVDSARGDDDFTPFRNIMNEYYARDTSRKIRSTFQSKGKSGKHLTGTVIYGYLWNEARDQWLVDPEAADVVKRIFAMTIDGYGPYQIASKLKEEKVLIPSAYLAQHGEGVNKNKTFKDVYGWGSSTICNILEKREYLGHTINFKTRKHFKDKKSHYVPEDEWTIFENTHEPIIDQQTFDLVQKIRGNVRRYPDGWGEAAPLTGLLYCADCGGKMYVHRTNNGKRISQYTCSQYSKVPVGKLCTTQHRINEDVVLSLVSEMLKAIAEYAKHDRAEFVRVVQEAQSSQQTAEVKKQRIRLATAKQRVSELEVLLCKIYEDNILGKLSDSRYATLDAQYEKEQSELTAEISALEKAVKSYEKHEKDADRFIALIDKYENFDKLTIAMLNEFIEKILVHERDRKGSIQTTQEVEIYFNFVGRFVPPAFGEVELTPEELEEIRKREERKDRLHQNYLKRKASGAQKRYEDKIKGRKKAEIEAKKAAIRAEDIAKGVFVPVSSLPQREPMKGVQTA